MEFYFCFKKNGMNFEVVLDHRQTFKKKAANFDIKTKGGTCFLCYLLNFVPESDRKSKVRMLERLYSTGIHRNI